MNERRTLEFERIDDVMSEVDRLLDGYASAGNWSLGQICNHLAGTYRMSIEGFGVHPRGEIGPDQIEYQAVLGRGWLSPWIEGGKFCGSRGMALPLLGLQVRLKDAAHDVDVIERAPDQVGAGPRVEGLDGAERGEHLPVGPRGVRGVTGERQVAHVVGDVGDERKTRAFRLEAERRHQHRSIDRAT